MELFAEWLERFLEFLKNCDSLSGFKKLQK